MPTRTEMGHPVLTKTFQELNPDAAMLFALCGQTSPLHTELTSEGHCRKQYNETESLTTYLESLGSKRVKPQQLTMWGMLEMPTHHTGIAVVPEIITYSAPSTIDTHFNSSNCIVARPSKLNLIICANL